MILREIKDKLCKRCKLKERNFNNVYQFELPWPNMATNLKTQSSSQVNDEFNIGDLYKLIELNKLKFNISDYSISQNTLDNVFINFVKEQTQKKLQMTNMQQNESINSSPKSPKPTQFPLNDSDCLLLDADSSDLIDLSPRSSSTNRMHHLNMNVESSHLENEKVSLYDKTFVL